MDLKLYDTLTREKRVFRPLDPSNVRMYVCGPTVYDFAHIGNARPVIVFDVLFRLLQHLAKQGTWDGGKGETKVTYVRNITDVDDKINARAAEEYWLLPHNFAIRRVTKKTDKQFHKDVKELGCLEPTFEPRATEHIAEMRTLIEQLVRSDNAYVAEDNVLFSVASMPDYGQLSKRPLDELIAGARIEVAPFKRDPRDFVLWKPSKPGEPAWPSPAGIKRRGRPGWHIECSAMAWKFLGETFDIHGGGIDLVFPHHENEIAQSRCAFHTPVMANYWMHNGFLQVEGEKMAKSAGNFVTIRELLTNWQGVGWPGEALRFNMLRAHYRQPIDWTFHSLDESHKTLWDWCGGLENTVAAASLPVEIVEALCDDLNTSQLISELHRLRRTGPNSAFLSALQFLGFSGRRENLKRDVASRLSFLTNGIPEIVVSSLQPVLHLLIRRNVNVEAVVEIEQRLTVTTRVIRAAEVEKLIAARNAAREARNYVEADRIRDELAKMGVVLKDTKDGTTWEIAR